MSKPDAPVVIKLLAKDATSPISTLKLDDQDVLVLWAVVENFLLRHMQTEWTRLTRIKRDLGVLIELHVNVQDI